MQGSIGAGFVCFLQKLGRLSTSSPHWEEGHVFFHAQLVEVIRNALVSHTIRPRQERFRSLERIRLSQETNDCETLLM